MRNPEGGQSRQRPSTGSAISGFIADIVGNGHEYFPEREDDKHEGDEGQAGENSPGGEGAARNQQQVDRHHECKEIPFEKSETERLFRGHESETAGERQKKKRAE